MSKVIEKSSPLRREPQATEGHPTYEEIKERAYEIYVKRGGAPGQALEDWLQAERELLEKYGKASRMAQAKAN